MKVQLDDDFELAPSGFADFIRRLRQNAKRIRVAVVQFELDLFHVSGHVLVVVRLDVDLPAVGVVIVLVWFLIVRVGDAAVDDRFDDSEALEGLFCICILLRCFFFFNIP